MGLRCGDEGVSRQVDEKVSRNVDAKYAGCPEGGGAPIDGRNGSHAVAVWVNVWVKLSRLLDFCNNIIKICVD